jgi:hypothetical protein
MSRRRTSPLKPLLNQIRSWAQQGRTDAWIGHQLDVNPSAIAEFRAEQGIVRAKPSASELGEHDAEAAPRPEQHGPVSLDSVADLLDAELAARPPRREAPAAAAEPAAETTEPKRRRRRSSAKAAAADEAAPPAETESPVEVAPAEPSADAGETPDGAKRRRRRSRGGRVTAADGAPEAVAAETVEPPPAEAPAEEPATAETPAPRRRRRTTAERAAAAAAEAEGSRVEGRLTRTLALELDAALLDDPVFREHWLAVRDVVAEVRAGEIVLRPR